MPYLMPAPFHVTCPHCGAKPRTCCTQPNGKTVRDHAARQRVADELFARGIDPRPDHWK